MAIEYITLAAGLLTLVFAAKEVWLQRTLRRDGVRVVGTVERFERSSGDSEGGGSSLYPIVAFADAGGNVHRCRGASSRKWPIGREVPVIYPSGAPGKARIDMRSERGTVVALLLVAGLAFTSVSLVLIAKG